MIKTKNNRGIVSLQRGFTLMELLVVMAISAILMVLVLGPVVQSFQLTRQAQAMVDSQDAARMALAEISRELGQAMYVYNNAQVSMTPSSVGLPAGANVDNTQAPIMLPVAQPGAANPQWFVLPYAMIDFILPNIYMHCNNPAHPSGKPRDYPRDIQVATGGTTRTELRGWPECPYCGSSDVEARPTIPLEQSVTHVRYFLALRYNNLGQAIDPPKIPVLNQGWVPPWGKNVVDGTENAVVLYRAEYNPYDDNLFPTDMPIGERIADPYFFYRTSNGADGNAIYKNWMRVARMVGIGKYEDLMTAEFNSSGSVRSVEPTIKFQTAAVENDTFNPAYSTDSKNDYPLAPPTVFSGTYGYWTPDNRVDVMRGDYCASPPGGIDYYTKVDASGDLIVMKRVPSGLNWVETIAFNITQYRAKGYVPPDGTKVLEMAFDVNENRGAINFALQPPRVNNAASGPVTIDVAAAINAAFHDEYATDRGGAIRRCWLNTFALKSPNSPLFPDQYLANAKIVPGSERVIGPDMNAGQHYGLSVRYERVPLALGNPGINQYMIDFDSGWLYFSRDPSLDLPEKDPVGNDCPIQVYYLVYFNQKDDVVRGDYLTKSLINVHMGMRMFDPDQGKAFPVDLTDKVKVRNAIR
jgi:prepilin-type N-terminal cleavage/methylation domain-containing protein